MHYLEELEGIAYIIFDVAIFNEVKMTIKVFFKIDK